MYVLTLTESFSFQCENPSLSPLDHYVAYLKDVYKHEQFPVHNKWPHVEGKKFINLSLLSKHRITPQESHQYTKAIFRGRISSIDPNKKMEMEDIAKTDDGSILKGRQRCILVEGAPGVGKSTFAWKLCRKWGKGKILQQYRVMLLLRLREKRVREIKRERDLFRRCEPIAVEEICRNDGEGVFLLLDGWDELPEELYEIDSFFLDLIQGQVLPDATVLVTSRPHASEIIVTECKDSVFQHIQVAGFTEENVQAFISSSVGDDSKLFEGLRTYVSYYPFIESMMYNPLNAAIVVEVYRNSYKEESTIPKTMTELYYSLIRSLLLRYLKGNPVLVKRRRTIRQFSDLPLDMYQQFCKVCRLAYEGITNHQQVIFTDLPDDFNSLDLMQCVPELYVDEGAVLSYNFLHLTIQEFLAAYHVSLQSTERQVKIVHPMSSFSGKNGMVLKFMAGLGKFEGLPEGTVHGLLRCFIGIMVSLKLDDVIVDGKMLDLLEIPTSCGYDIKLESLHCLYEAKARMSLLNTLAEVRISELFVDILSPFDYFIMGYVVSHTSCQWNIQLGDDFLEQIGEGGNPEIQAARFAKGTNEDKALYPVSASTVSIDISCPLKPTEIKDFLGANPSFLNRITHFCLRIELFDSTVITLLLHNLQLLPQLKSLWLRVHSCNHSLENSSMEISRQTPSSLTLLIRKLKDYNLKGLGLSNLRIFELPECQAFAQWLSSPSCCLEDLDIGGNYLRCEFTRVVVLGLRQNYCLHSLNLSTSQIPKDILAPLFRLSLTKLWLKNCEVDEEGAKEISSALCNNANLKELNLSGNYNVHDVGASALASALRDNMSLETVILESCGIGSRGIANIAQALCRNNVLKKLDISDNFTKDSFTAEAIRALSDMLEQNTALRILDLRWCGLTYEGVQPLLHSLTHNATLKTLLLDEMKPQNSSHDERVVWFNKII